jgi:HSP20 family protein
MALMSLRDDPFDTLPALQRALARMLESPAVGWSVGPSSRSVFPPINVFQDPSGGLVVRAEAPGIDPATLDVQVEPQRLTISGERRGDAGNADGYHRRERRFGRFSRSFQIPADLDVEKVAASYRNGVLDIRIEKAAAARPRRIQVASEQEKGGER